MYVTLPREQMKMRASVASRLACITTSIPEFASGSFILLASLSRPSSTQTSFFSSVFFLVPSQHIQVQSNSNTSRMRCSTCRRILCFHNRNHADGYNHSIATPHCAWACLANYTLDKIGLSILLQLLEKKENIHQAHTLQPWHALSRVVATQGSPTTEHTNVVFRQPLMSRQRCFRSSCCAGLQNPKRLEWYTKTSMAKKRSRIFSRLLQLIGVLLTVKRRHLLWCQHSKSLTFLFSLHGAS